MSTPAIELKAACPNERLVWEAPVTVEFLLRDAQTGASVPGAELTSTS